MLRRRPLARMAVRTTVIAGTAAAVGAHAAARSTAPAPPVQPVEAEGGSTRIAPPPQAAPPLPTDVPDTIEQLTRLGALRESGVLTQAEFEAQKAKLLADR